MSVAEMGQGQVRGAACGDFCRSRGMGWCGEDKVGRVEGTEQFVLQNISTVGSVATECGSIGYLCEVWRDLHWGLNHSLSLRVNLSQ